MTTKTKIGPFKYDIVGSFLRTPELKDAIAKHRAGELTDAQFIEIQHAEIKKLVEIETQHGLKAVTDGEFSRSWWHLDFFMGPKGC